MNLLVTHPRLTGSAERIAYGLIMVILTRLVARGYLDASMAEYIAVGLVSGGGAVYAWWINRPQKLLEAAANVPNPNTPSGKTVVLASPEMAAATPSAPTVISSTDVKVVPQPGTQ